MHHSNASLGYVVFLLVTGDIKNMVINLNSVLNICAGHVPPPLCPTAPPKGRKPHCPLWGLTVGVTWV